MATHQCPNCGMELPEGRKEKLCPRCVMKEIIHNGIEDAESEVLEDAKTHKMAQQEAGVAEILPEAPGDRIGRYKLLQKLDEGGMGIVWMAEQMEPVRRMVALKVIKPGMASKEVLARFEAERQALALMDHPNIAKVLDAGATPNGRPYFVMDLVKGVPLIRFCDEQRLSVKERLNLFIPICRAIQHAHQKGIIHRDLKPSNVLVALYDGKPVPKVIDFGVAKAMGQRLTERTLFTQFGALLGTLEYMSPEQAELNQLDVDTRSDIYSLGVLLYELLTGTTPLTHETLRKAGFEEVLRRIREEEPPKPSVRLSTTVERLTIVSAQRKLDPQKLTKVVRGELDWIVMKALEKDRARRYETATAFALDLQSYLNGDPVDAGPPTVRYRVKKFVRKHRGAITAAMGFLVLLVVASVFSTGLALWANRERKEKQAQQQRADERAVAAENAKAKAENQRQRTEEMLSLMEIQRAEEMFEANDPGSALAYLARILRRDPRNNVAAQRLVSALTQRSNAQPLTKPLEHKKAIQFGVFSPDGQRLLTSSLDMTARVWDAVTGEPLMVMKHDAGVRSAHFSADGQQVVTASADGTARIWDARTGQVTVVLQHDGPVEAAEFSPDGQWVLTASWSSAHVWNVRGGQQMSSMKRKPDVTEDRIVEGRRVRLTYLAAYAPPVVSAHFSADGRRIITTSDRFGGGSWARVWDALTGRALTEPLPHTDDYPAQLSPEGQRVLTTRWDGAHVRDIQTGQLLVTIKQKMWDIQAGQPPTTVRESRITFAEFSPDGQRVVTASSDGIAQVWDAWTGQPLTPPMNHRGGVNCARFSPDGQRVITQSDDTVQVWDTRTGQPLGQPMKHSTRVKFTHFSPDGQRVITAAHDDTVQVWDAWTGQPLMHPIKHRFGVEHHFGVASAQFSPDGLHVALVSETGSVLSLWDIRTDYPSSESLKHKGRVMSAHFSSDGRWIVTASLDKTARVWDARTGQPITEPLKYKQPVPVNKEKENVAFAKFNPDGRWVVTGSSRGAQVWNVLTGQALVELDNGGEAMDAEFSPDGKKVVTVATNQTVRVWDAYTGQPLTEPMKHDGFVLCARFSPDGRRVVTACCRTFPNYAQVWDAHTGRPLTKRMIHNSVVESAQFSMDGRWVVTTSQRIARVWDAHTGQPLTEPLTHKDWVSCAQFSPDGQQVLTASWDKTAQLWDLRKDQPLTPPMKHKAGVQSAKFSPDGKWVVTASLDNTARVWDTRTGQPLTEPMRHNAPVESAEFSFDGQRIVTASWDGTARVWEIPSTPLPTPEWLLTLAETVGNRRLNVRGATEYFSISEYFRLKKEILARSSTEASLIWAKWYFADRSTRSIFPNWSITVPEYVRRRIDDNTLDSLQEAIRLLPNNGLAYARLAEQILAQSDKDNPRRVGEADFYSRYALKWSPNDDKVKKIRADIEQQIKALAKP